MANKGVKQSTRGNLNKDVDPKAMRNGDYEDALDVLHINKGSNKSLNAEPTLGNKYAFTIEPRVAQNKRIRFNIPTQANYEATVFKTDGVTPLFSFFFSNPTDFTVNFAVGAGAAGLQINFVETTSTFVTVEILTPAYYDWFVSSVGSVEFTFDVLQEALSPNYIGIPKIIGSVDLLGNLFVFSTTKTQEQRGFTITDIYNSGGRIGISTAEPHGLQNGFEVSISGTQIDRYADGLWIVQVINASSFILQLSDASTLNLSAPATGTVSVYVRGYGEIGVAVKDLNTDSWQYTRLLGSKEFNFDTFHLIECRAEANNLGKSLYFISIKKNEPNVFYYNKDNFTQDGALQINGGQYQYDSIEKEINLIFSPKYPIIDLNSIGNTGGKLKIGYKRYSIRYLDIFNTHTAWSELSPPVCIFEENTDADAYKIMGSADDTSTTKTVTLRISNIPNIGLYRFIELAVVEFFGGSVTATNIKREEIVVFQNSIYITHDGNEPNQTSIDVGDLTSAAESTFINTPGSITIIDNRLVLANYEPKYNQDFSAVFSNVKHSIKRKKLETVGFFNDVKYGEYMKPENIYYNRGYMLNETYRFAGRLVFHNGTKSDYYFIDDIIFDTNPTNSVSKKPNNRISTIPDYSLTEFISGNPVSLRFQENKPFLPQVPNQVVSQDDANLVDIAFSGSSPNPNSQGIYYDAAFDRYQKTWTEINAYCFFVEFENFNLDIKTKDGKNLRSVVDYIEIGVCPCVPEVLGSGVFFPADVFQNQKQYANTPSNFSSRDYTRDYGALIGLTGQQQPKIGSFMFPDYQLGLTEISRVENDVIINYGRPCLQYSNYWNASNRVIDEFTGITESAIPLITFPNNRVTPPTQIKTTHSVEEIKTVPYDSSILLTSIFPSVTYISNPILGIFYSGQPNPPYLFNRTYALVLDTEVDFLGYKANVTQNTTTSFFYPRRRDTIRQIQYFRKINNKYGDISLSKAISTYSFLKVDVNFSNQSKVEVFGGDTYTQKSYLKYYNGYDGNPIYGTIDIGNPKGGILGFFSQNRNNIQMRFRATDQAVYPNGSGATSNDRLQDCLDKEETRQIAQAYLGSNPFLVRLFDPLSFVIKSFKARIAYSALKPQNSIMDYYRSFPPLQYYDLDPQYGEITHIEVLNNELYAWQERKVNRMFFNTTGVLTTVEGDISVLGNQGVLSRKPIALSAFGTKHKFSVVKGTSAGGQDVAYWINSESNMLMRFGADGSVAISILWGLMGFLNDNLKWAQQNLKYTGNRYGYGIYGVWDERFKEAIFTVRAAKDVDDWQIRQSYTANRSNFSVVRNYNQVQFSTFEESPDIFICTQDHTATADTEPGVGVNWQSYWVVAPHTDNNYYNEYTIALNEIKNGFSTFYTHKPAIYMRYRNKFLTAHPKMKYSNVSFEHREGDYLTWYNYEGEEQTSTGYIMPIINIDPEAIKWYLAVWMVTKFAPFRMEFYTDKHESYLDAEDFEEREGVWISNIKNDLDNITQRNDLDTSQLYGSYLKVKIFFEPKKFQQFFDFVTLLRLSQRSYMK